MHVCMSGVLSLVNGLQAEQTEVTLPPMSCSELRLPYQNTKPKIIDNHRKRAGGRPVSSDRTRCASIQVSDHSELDLSVLIKL